MQLIVKVGVYPKFKKNNFKLIYNNNILGASFA